MESNEGKMLSFYKKQNIAPVFQNIEDIDAHFHRRETLYRQMGLSSSNFSGKKILEIGPGTGQNALYLASQSPSSLTLCEPNPSGIKKIEETFMPFPDFKKLLKVERCTIEELDPSLKYDLVICEGLIGASGHPDPRKLIKSIASHVSPDGILVLTSMDYPAYLSEMLRRLFGYELTKKMSDFESKVNILVNVFGPHLKTLPGMTREPSDWAIDNLLNPASVGSLVAFDELVAIVSELKYGVLGTSPRFIADWAWYKDAALKVDFFNESALHSYWLNAHGFMDYSHIYQSRTIVENKTLSNICCEIQNDIRLYEETDLVSYKEKIINNIRTVISGIKESMPFVAESLEEALSWIQMEEPDPVAISESTKFGRWFGRSQTYTAFFCD